MDGAVWCSGRSEQPKTVVKARLCQMWNRANAERGAQWDFPMPSNAERRSSHSAENKPCYRELGGYVSNMIYQDYIDYCIRHFI
jgi:hypothetical protein